MHDPVRIGAVVAAELQGRPLSEGMVRPLIRTDICVVTFYLPPESGRCPPARLFRHGEVGRREKPWVELGEIDFII